MNRRAFFQSLAAAVTFGLYTGKKIAERAPIERLMADVKRQIDAMRARGLTPWTILMHYELVDAYLLHVGFPKRDPRFWIEVKMHGLRVGGRREKGWKQGHPYDEPNTYLRAKGWRSCRTCHRERMRARNRRLASILT